MSVRPKHYRRSPVVVAVPCVVAADLVKVNGPHNGSVIGTHPLAGAFLAFLGDKIPTKRQAAAFLAAYPHYRSVVEAA
jgi:hypothetical protein